MSTTDLSILADAVTFAIMVAIGGAVAYAIARAAWKRRSMPQAAKVGLSAIALVAVGLAGVAVWPSARSSVTTAADLAGFDVASIGPETDDPSLAFTNPTYVASAPRGRAARVWEAAPSITPGGIDFTPPEGTNTGSGPTNEGPTTETTSPGGGGTSTSTTTTTPPTTTPPTTEPPTTEPPTTEPPTTEPPTTEPPTTDPTTVPSGSAADPPTADPH